MALGMAGLMALPGPALAEEASSNCTALGIGLLNPYFEVPWSADFAGRFSSFTERPSAAAYWGVETPDMSGQVESRLVPGAGLSIKGASTPVAIFQAVSPPPLEAGYGFIVVDVTARVFVRKGIVALALSNGPAPFSISAYPRPPFRTVETGRWVNIGEQIVLGPYSPGFDRVSILSVTPDSDFSVGCITYVAVPRRTDEPYIPLKPARDDVPASRFEGADAILPRL